jgi:hypothetical protein
LTSSRLFKTSNHLERRGLATSRWTEHGEELAVTNGEVGVFDGLEVAKRLTDPMKFDDLLAHDSTNPPHLATTTIRTKSI